MLKPHENLKKIVTSIKTLLVAACNTLHPNISMYLLYAVFYTFLKSWEGEFV